MPRLDGRFINAKISDELKQNIDDYCKQNGYKKTEFIEIALRNEYQRRISEMRNYTTFISDNPYQE